MNGQSPERKLSNKWWTIFARPFPFTLGIAWIPCRRMSFPTPKPLISHGHPPAETHILSPSVSAAGRVGERARPLTGDERKRQAIGMGGWRILGPMAFVLGMAGEPIELRQSCPDSLKLGSLLRQGQIPWIAGQLHRVFTLHRMTREIEADKRRVSWNMEKQTPKDAETLAQDVTSVKKALNYATGV